MDGLRMRRVIRCVIKAEFTPDQWGLTGTSGRDEAAAALNETLRNTVNAGDSSPPSVFETMALAQSRFADLGGDGETARNLVAQVVRLVYGND